MLCWKIADFTRSDTFSIAYIMKKNPKTDFGQEKFPTLLFSTLDKSYWCGQGCLIWEEEETIPKKVKKSPQDDQHGSLILSGWQPRCKHLRFSKISEVEPMMFQLRVPVNNLLSEETYSFPDKFFYILQRVLLLFDSVYLFAKRRLARHGSSTWSGRRRRSSL